jgi:hypothetical protein
MPQRSKQDVQALLRTLNIQCEIDDEVYELVSKTSSTIKAFLKKEISFQEALFIENYLSNGFHAGRAAESANFQGLEAGAYGHIGAGLLSRDNVRRIVARRIAAKAMNSDEILAEWAEVAKADMSNFLRVQQTIDPNTGARISVAVADMEKADSLGMLHMIKKAKVGADGSFSFELRDQDKALDQIARHLGMFEKDNTLQIPSGLIELLQQSPEDRRETLDRYDEMIDEDDD